LQLNLCEIKLNLNSVGYFKEVIREVIGERNYFEKQTKKWFLQEIPAQPHSAVDRFKISALVCY